MSETQQVDFAITTHNGTITVRNPASGEHRTFRIATQKQDARFAPGERIVSLLVGQNNETDYQSFGILKPDGRVIVWRKHLGTKFERYGRLVENLKQESEKFGLEFQWSAKCRKCNRKLTCPESLASGIGPTCAGEK